MANYENQSLTRAFGLLEILARARNPMTLAEISGQARLNRTTVFRMLSVLNDIGYVHKSPDSSEYSLGYKMFVFGSRANQLENIRQHAHRFAKNLAATIGLTVHIGTLEGPQAVYLDKITVPDAAPLMTAVGMHVDAHASAMGKALLAFRPEAEVLEIFEHHPLQPHTEHTMTGLPTLLRDLQKVRDLGYATEENEFVVGLHSVAAPIVNTLGRANVALSVTAPSTELSARQLDELGIRLAETTSQVTTYIVSREGA